MDKTTLIIVRYMLSIRHRLLIIFLHFRKYTTINFSKYLNFQFLLRIILLKISRTINNI